MSNNASKYSAEDEQTSKVSARSKSVLLYSAAFLLAELMMLFILKANHFYPFGTKSMLIMDMRDQNVEFLASLRSMIHGDNSLFSLGHALWAAITWEYSLFIFPVRSRF